MAIFLQPNVFKSLLFRSLKLHRSVFSNWTRCRISQCIIASKFAYIINYTLNKLQNFCIVVWFSRFECHWTKCRISASLLDQQIWAGADPGFFLGGGAPLRNDVTGRWGKQILKANMKKDSSQGGGVRTPCTLPLDPPLSFLQVIQNNINVCTALKFNCKFDCP